MKSVPRNSSVWNLAWISACTAAPAGDATSNLNTSEVISPQTTTILGGCGVKEEIPAPHRGLSEVEEEGSRFLHESV